MTQYKSPEGYIWSHRWLLMLLAVILVAGTLCTYWLFIQVDHSLRDELLQQAHLVARSVNLEYVQALSGTEDDLNLPEYQRLKKYFSAVCAVTPKYRFAYLMGCKPDGTVYFHVDSEPAGSEDESPAGQIYDEVTLEDLHVFETQSALTLGPQTDRWGTWITAMVPLSDPKTNEFIAMLGIDIDVREWYWSLAAESVLPVGLTMLAFITILFVGSYLLQRRAQLEGHIRWMGWLEPVLVIVVGLILTLFTAWLVQDASVRNQADAFRNLAVGRTAAVSDAFQDIQDFELEGLARFYENSDYVTLEEFQHYAEYLTRNPSADAWALVALVPEENKEDFEQETHTLGIDEFEIWQKDTSGERVPATARDVYYPMFRVIPEEANTVEIGFDLGSVPVWLAAIEEALHTGLITATEPVTLEHETGSQKGILIFRPVYADLQRKQPKGLALVVLRLGDVLAGTIPSDVLAKELLFVDGHKPLETLAASWLEDNLPVESLVIMRPILAFGKTFIIKAHAWPEFLRIHPARAGLSVALSGLLLTAALTIVVSVLLRNRQALEKLVLERTAALLKSEEHLAATLRSIGDGVIVCNHEGNVVSINHAAEALTGWTSADAIGCPVEEVFHIINAQTRETTMNPVRHTLKEGVNVSLANHTTLIARDHKEHQIADSCAPIRDTSGTVIGAVLVFRDVTSEYQRRAELQKSEARFRSIIAVSNTGAWEFHQKTKYLWCSPEYFGMLGLDSDNYIMDGSSNLDEVLINLIHPDDKAQAVSHFIAYIDSGSSGMFENFFRMHHADGSWVWIWSRGQTLHNSDGSLSDLTVGTHINITERKQYEEALRESEAYNRTMLEVIPDIIIQVNAEGEYLDIRATSEDQLIYPREDILGKKIPDVIPENVSNVIMKSIHDVFKTKKLHSVEYELTVPAGNLFFEARVVPLNEERVLILIRDITNRKRAEEEKEYLQSQLTQAQKMESVGRLAGGVAHDFNNMLGVILGQTEIGLDLVQPGDTMHAILEDIQKATKHSADLTRQLLAFARKQTVVPKVIDLNETVAGILKMLRQLIGENIEISWKSRQGLWLVKMDPSQIDQILANLCVNARDAIAGVGKITIESENITFDEEYCTAHAGFIPGDFVQLAVSDNGCGMDAETHSRLFEPFFTTKELGKGTGLGLSTVYGTVKQNKGFINVYSELKQGTTLRIYLPRYIAENVPKSEHKLAEAMLGGSETILLVEDEPQILNVTTMLLKKLGYTVLPAPSPGEAILLAKEHSGQFNLLMTDLVMPEMNGRDLAKYLLSTYTGITHLYMSGYTADFIGHQGVLDENEHFIQKPFSIKDLAVKLREVLDSNQDNYTAS